MQSSLRATDDGVELQEEFKPGADPDAWIEQMAGPYQERPWAVIRELFQNASDAILTSTGQGSRLIEFALLNKSTTFSPNNHNFVIRDSGDGMSDMEFCKNVGILGNSARRGDPNTIGQFGVGFYSTHGICHEVTFISQKEDTATVIGWKYAPPQKTFYRVNDDDIKALLAHDFENHPDASRRRSHGSSVYLTVDFDTHPLCLEWLAVENVLRNVKRDFFILPARIYLADYSEGNAAPIVNMNGEDVRSSRHNLEVAPWEVEKHASAEPVRELLRTQLPYTQDEELPREFSVFTTKVGNGTVSGLLFAVQDVTEGTLSLCLKRMWVESAKDCKPQICLPVFGVVNIEPGTEKSDVQITPSRDHLIRNDAYRSVSITIEDACISFLAQQGKHLVQGIQQGSSHADGLEETVKHVSKLVNASAFFSILVNKEVSYRSLLADIPAELVEVIQDEDCPKGVIDSVSALVDSMVSGSVGNSNLAPALEALQEKANEHAAKERSSTDRDQQYWNPRTTKAFLEQVGRYVPVTLAARDRRRDGRFDVRTVTLPIAAIATIDPASTKGVDVLLKGTAEEYLSENQDKGCVILPFVGERTRRESQFIPAYLALINKLNERQLPQLTFVEIKKEPFKPIKVRDDWIPLIECFATIVNAAQHASAGTNIDVDALGYQGDAVIPLLVDTQGTKTRLIINAYNVLMKDLMATFNRAAERNDESSRGLISSICHELYHHALHVDAVAVATDTHVLGTRNDVFSQVVAMLDKYNDLRG